VNCREALKQISDYLDNELDENLKRDLEVHIKSCRHCHVVFDTTRKTIELYCDGRLFQLPEPVHRRLHEAIRRRWEEKRGQTPP